MFSFPKIGEKMYNKENKKEEQKKRKNEGK